MRKNRLGSSDLIVTEIGLGCMSLGTDEKEAIKIVHTALDRGINFLDTADLYDYGKNEEIVGKAIQGRRSEIVLATKVGNRWEPGKATWHWDPSKAYIKEAVKGSLQRLQTDYIDLYQLHGGTLEDNIDETIEAFEELKAEGWIRFYGISSIRPNVIREYVNRSNIVSVMSQYSIFDRRPEEEVLGLLEKHNIGLIARGPVAKGLLSENGASKIQDGYLDYSPNQLNDVWRQLIQSFHDGRKLSQIAIRYVLSHTSVATAIPGTSNIQQLLDNIEAAKLAPLTEDEINRIKRISIPNKYVVHR